VVNGTAEGGTPSLLKDLRFNILLALYGSKEYRPVPNEDLDKIVSLLFPNESRNHATDIELFVSLGLIQKHNTLNSFSFPQMFDVTLTEEGKRIANTLSKGRTPTLRPHSELQTSIFIASAFGYDEIDDLYHQHFKTASELLGYKTIRVDLTEPNQTITKKIMEGITDTACLLADLTYARPSVYFEVGYAVGLGVPLILTCRNDHLHGKKDEARVHFDLEQYKISFWSQDSKGNFKWASESMTPEYRLKSVLKSRMLVDR
jgi:hypothetical protein